MDFLKDLLQFFMQRKKFWLLPLVLVLLLFGVLVVMTSGSAIGTRCQGIPAGTLCNRWRGCETYSAIPPSICTPRTVRFSQQLVCPIEQG